MDPDKDQLLQSPDGTKVVRVNVPRLAGRTGPLRAPGELIAGRYRVEALLKHECLYDVVRALDTIGSHESVVLWVVEPGILFGAGLDRFLADVQRARAVDRPGLRRIQDCARDGDLVVLRVETLVGPTVADRLAAGTPMDLVGLVALASRVAAALDAGHAAGLVHGLLRPADVTLVGKDRAVIDGMGIWGAAPRTAVAHAFERDERFLAPEVRAGRAATPRSDVYSLATTLAELATGGGTAPSGSALRARLDRANPLVARALESALADDPTRRPPSGQALAEALEAAARSVMGTLPRRDEEVSTRPVPLVDAREIPGATPPVPSPTWTAPVPGTQPRLEARTFRRTAALVVACSVLSGLASWIGATIVYRRGPALPAPPAQAAATCADAIAAKPHPAPSAPAARPAPVEPSPKPVPAAEPAPVSTPPAADSGCPAGMVPVPNVRVCIDRLEAPGTGMPASGVTFAQARQACADKGERLCRPYEWEAACRGKDAASYPYGGVFDPEACNVRGHDIEECGSRPRCASRTGALDMSGNVAEWVQGGGVRGGSALDGHDGRCSHPRPSGDPLVSDVGYRCCVDLR